ncbi:hypothetical protein F7725_002846 [Dissostichus mawsoni]|uniref:Uncharacterized protein n=1 Tax=Dissostichus mawsoni TaxID=36200 RepID=A0A7J5YBP5_DISMA|nr:hypothetical protein F7725_002846 [Dissostichus mawsoni]
MNSFSKAPAKHQSSERHMMSVVHLKTFGECRHILDQAEDFDQKTVHCASGHLAQLKSFDCCFFLFTFTGTFEIADVLFGIPQSKTLDMQFSLARIADFCQSVEREKAKFNDIFEKTVQAVGQPSALRGNPDAHAHYSQLHAAVIDNILIQSRNRFEDHQRLMFVGLLDSPQFEKIQAHISRDRAQESDGELLHKV